MAWPSPKTAVARLKNIARRSPVLAIVPGNGFHHGLTGLRVEAKISCPKIPGFIILGDSNLAAGVGRTAISMMKC